MKGNLGNSGPSVAGVWRDRVQLPKSSHSLEKIFFTSPINIYFIISLRLDLLKISQVLRRAFGNWNVRRQIPCVRRDCLSLFFPCHWQCLLRNIICPRATPITLRQPEFSRIVVVVRCRSRNLNNRLSSSDHIAKNFRPFALLFAVEIIDQKPGYTSPIDFCERRRGSWEATPQVAEAHHGSPNKNFERVHNLRVQNSSTSTTRKGRGWVGIRKWHEITTQELK